MTAASKPITVAPSGAAVVQELGGSPITNAI